MEKKKEKAKRTRSPCKKAIPMAPGKKPEMVPRLLPHNESFSVLRNQAKDMDAFEKMNHLHMTAQQSAQTVLSTPKGEKGGRESLCKIKPPVPSLPACYHEETKTKSPQKMVNFKTPSKGLVRNEALTKVLPPSQIPPASSEISARPRGNTRTRSNTVEASLKKPLITRSQSCPQLGSRKEMMDFDFLSITGDMTAPQNPPKGGGSRIRPVERSTTDSSLLNTLVRKAMSANRQPLRLPSLPKIQSRLERVQQGTNQRKLTFSTPYEQVEILVSETNGQLIASAGSIHNLLGAMLGEHADEDFITHILYGYRNMLTPLQFFDFLKNHFDKESGFDPKFSEDELQEWKNVVKERVVLIMEHWVKNHFYDFKLSYNEDITKEEEELRKKIEAFVIQIRSYEQLGQKSFQLQDLLQETDLSRRLQDGNVTMNHRHNFMRQLLPKLRRSPLPHMRKVGNKKKLCFAGVELLAWVCIEVQCDERMARGVCGLFVQEYLLRLPQKDRLFVTSDTDFYTFSPEAKEELKQLTFVKPLCIFDREPENFMDIHPVELARQLVLMEFDIFRKITPLELLRQSWTKTKTQHLCPNVMNLIDQFNTVSFWVATELINTENTKDRLNVLKRFICIADALRNLKAFNPMMEIVIGLNLGPVSRLTTMWESLPEKYQDIFDSLMSFTSTMGNFRNYRGTLKASAPPCLPYLAIYLKDLTFIAEGNSKFMDENGFILNFERIRMEATILREIQYYQEHDYPFDKGKSILAFLRSSLSRFSSESELWSKSDALKNDKALKKQTSVRMPRLPRPKGERPSSSLVS